jgi:outer membrane protein OmpA-like peptidoglycan-associated protein
VYPRSLTPVLTALLVGATPPYAFADEIGDEPGTDEREQRANGATLLRAVESADAGYDTSGLIENGDLAYRGPRIPVASAYAAPLFASEDTCMGSRTFGVQAIGFGVSFATTWQDHQCRRVKNARELFALGYREAAVQLLCLDDEVRAAMARAGTPCEGVVRLVSVTPTPPAPPAEPPPIVSVDDVLFDFDRSTLRPEANAILQPVLTMLQGDPSLQIDIEGHTDWIGTDAYNQGLSERRARAVVEWFVARGIARERISAIGRGEAEPVAVNTTSQGRQLNRRVEIRRR